MEMNMDKDKKGEKSCGAVIINREGKILLIRQNAGHWDFPKGHVEKGETEEETALREVEEETGLKVKLLDGFRETINYEVKDHVPKEVVFFAALTGENPVITNQQEEVSDSGFFTAEEAEKTITFEKNREILQKAMKCFKDSGYEIK